MIAGLFSWSMTPYDEQRTVKSGRPRTLFTMRDGLLPKLVSGLVRIEGVT